MSDNDDRQPWERMPKESAKAFAAFNAYLNMNPAERSYRSLAKTYDKSVAYRNVIGGWGSKWQWQARVKAWEAHQQQLNDLEFEKARAQVRQSSQGLVRIMTSLAGRAAAQVERDTRDGKKVSLAEFDTLARAMRRVLDMAQSEFDYQPTHRTETDITGLERLVINIDNSDTD